jgi:hypothetical protein
VTNRTNLDAPTLAALQAANVTMFMLLELDLDAGRQYLCDLPVGMSVTWNGNSYSGAQGIGSIEAVTESDVGAKGLTLTLSAVSQSAIASALTEHVQGREVLLRLAVVDGATLRVDPAVWRGYADLLISEDDGAQPVLRLTAEHAMIAWQQPSGALYSDAQHQSDHPGDKFFEYVVQMADLAIRWPNKSFFRQ